ncbi:type II toxin-antitoxin system RelE/ParE family toxin [Chitinimonas koreensis]|uniref:type II toxin-antitoxin system RelE/ParE family toxin n=1 Tax=Chitinimonas koreensis TaxID=356302 RepID=UPI00041487CC|nr:type II toxin-antitoxin system RelE/ParE family toxin [Chitinimonas koreensis]QNM97819.1 type II toxin-antitoxin system RelE/ParE family toxin [Chitinimonas koreensis]
MIRIRVTRNFDANVDRIEAFWQGLGHETAVDRLLVVIRDEVVPNLARFPRLGRAARLDAVESVQGLAAWGRVRRRLGSGELREYLFDDYLLLYLYRNDEIHLLAIRHAREAGFDLQLA